MTKTIKIRRVITTHEQEEVVQLPAFRKSGNRYMAVYGESISGSLEGLMVDNSETLHEISTIVIRGTFERGENITPFEFAAAMGQAQSMLEKDFDAIAMMVEKKEEKP